jgi:hypothetical protein
MEIHQLCSTINFINVSTLNVSSLYKLGTIKLVVEDGS